MAMARNRNMAQAKPPKLQAPQTPAPPRTTLPFGEMFANVYLDHNFIATERSREDGPAPSQPSPKTQAPQSAPPSRAAEGDPRAKPGDGGREEMVSPTTLIERTRAALLGRRSPPADGESASPTLTPEARPQAMTYAAALTKGLMSQGSSPGQSFPPVEMSSSVTSNPTATAGWAGTSGGSVAAAPHAASAPVQGQGRPYLQRTQDSDQSISSLEMDPESAAAVEDAGGGLGVTCARSCCALRLVGFVCLCVVCVCVCVGAWDNGCMGDLVAGALAHCSSPAGGTSANRRQSARCVVDVHRF